MQAVVFGPGRIGCGLVGLALRHGGHEVTFVGRDPCLVANLRRVGGYRVLLTGGGAAEAQEVDGVACLDVGDAGHVTEAVADADLVVTARAAAGVPGQAVLLSLSRPTWAACPAPSIPPRDHVA